MIRKLTTAALLATTMLGGTIPFAYGRDYGIDKDDTGKSPSSNQAYRIKLRTQEDASQKIIDARLLAPHEIEETFSSAIPTQKEESLKQEEALEQQREANAKQAFLLEEQKKEAEFAAAQKREQQAKLERDAEEFLNRSLNALDDYLNNKLPNKIASHFQRADERRNNAPYAQYTGGKPVKTHYLAVYANDDPQQRLIKLSATDNNLFNTLKSKWDRFPESATDLGLEKKMKAAKLEQIKKELSGNKT